MQEYWHIERGLLQKQKTNRIIVELMMSLLGNAKNYENMKVLFKAIL